MTPEEYAYYQQPQQQEEGGLLDFLGKAAIAAGAVAGGIAGARYLKGRIGQQAPPRQAKRPAAPNYEAVRRVAATQMPENPKVTRSQTPPSPAATADRVRRMEQITREARAERMPGVIQTDLASLVAQTGASAPSLSAVPVSATPVRPATGPIVTDLSRLQGQATELPSTYYKRQPGSFADITSAQREITGVNAAERLSQDPELLSLVRQQKAEELSESRSMQAKAQAEYRKLLSEKADEVIQSVRAEPKNFLQERLEQSGYVPTQVEKQQSVAPVISDQSINAVYSAEDQQTGRVKQQLQRNEDVDLSQVDLMEDMAEANIPQIIEYEADAPINQVASQLPDGRPLDQAEGLDLQTGERFAIRQGSTAFAPRSALGATGLVPGQRILSEQKPQGVANTSAVRFMKAERDKIARELDIDTAFITPQGQIRIDTELAKRLGPQASTFGPKYTARAQALQTFANTGNPIAAETIKRFGLSPVTFETFENMPAEKKRLFESAAPMSLEGYPSTELQAAINQTGIKVNAPGFGVVDIATLRKPVITESTARQADEFIEGAKADKLNWLQEKSDEIKRAKQEILLERKERIKTTAENLLVKLEQAKANGQNDVVNELEGQLDNLRTLYKNPELVGDYKEFGEGGIRHLDAQLRGVQRSTNEQIAALEKRYPTTLANRTGEASRVFGVLDVDTGEFIPETMEVRSGRSDVDLGRKGGGGRNIAEYTAGERLDEEIRALQGGGRIRDYDVETGAPVQRWQGDSTQTGRTIDEYGIRLTRQRAADPEVRPSVPQYTQQEIEEEALRLSKADPYGDVPVAPEYAEVVESLGYQQPTPERRASVLLSEQVRKGQLSFPKQDTNSYPSSILARPVRINFPKETTKPSTVQLSFPSDVVPATSAAARVRVTPADQAAQQLEAYMGRLQRGRNSPLTSQVRIQPSLF